jgi:hypothetical protein
MNATFLIRQFTLVLIVYCTYVVDLLLHSNPAYWITIRHSVHFYRENSFPLLHWMDENNVINLIAQL